MKPMLGYKPPWYKSADTQKTLGKLLVYGIITAAFVMLFLYDSSERDLIREVNAKTSDLIEKFPALTDEQILSELEAIRSMTTEPEPEPEDPY